MLSPAVRTEHTTLPDKGLDASCATVYLVKRHFANHLATVVLPQLLDLLNLLRKAGGEGLLEGLRGELKSVSQQPNSSHEAALTFVWVA